MTAEKINLVVSLSAPLVADPLSWSSLSPEQQDAFRLLMPSPSFDAEQRFYLSLWWLPISVEQLDQLNALTPPRMVIQAREAEGQLYIGADLLSDALDGRRLSALLPILETLPITYRPAETWPVAEGEDEE